MSGILGFGSRNTQPNKLGSVQVQTSEYGVCLPVLFGANRLAAKLIDYLNFTAVKQTQGGKGGGGVTGYEYFAAVLLLLWKNGQYASDGIGNIYDAGGAQQLTETTETFTIPGGGGSHTVANAGSAFYYDEGVSYQASYSITVNDYGSDGLATLSGLDTRPMEKVASGPGALQYSVNATGTYTFSGSDAGKTVTITYAYTATPTHVAATSAPAEYLNLSIFRGTRPQSAWGYLTSYGSHALDYPGLVLAGDQSMDLGSSATVPSYNFEGLNGNGLAFGSGIMDCDPAAIITAILTDPFLGMAYPYLGDLTQLSDYCVANGIFLSPYYDSAKAASSVIEDLAALANSEVFSSWDGTLKAVPYGDTTVVGFGKTFTPNTQPLYDFTIDDFVEDGNEEPLTISIPNIADCSNYIKLEFKNRAQSYNVDTVDDINQASVNVIGLRPAETITAHAITTADVAQLVLNATLTRKSYPYRNFKWKLPPAFPHLEQMDIVTVTHPNPAYGITRWPVRITEIEEDEQTAELTVTAKDFPWGSGQPAKYPRNPSGGDPLPGRQYPGSIAAPIIFEAMDRISRSGGPEIWIGVAGQTQYWGGCHVWMSKDGVDYDNAPIGTIHAQARMGQLVNAVLAVADPDTTSTFDVEMAGYNPSALNSSSTAAADGALTLSLVDNELISYSTTAAATVSGVPVQQLTSYIRRGVFGTLSAAHGAGSIFLRLDGAVFSYEYDPTLVGTTLHFKFTSFNQVGLMEESLSDVIAYDFLLDGKFGNSGKSIQNNLAIDTVLDGSAADIRIYQAGTSPGTAGTFTREDGTTLTAPAATLTGNAFSTTFYIGFNPATGTYSTFTDYNRFQLFLSYGWIGAGTVTTCDSTGSGGTTGGGGSGGRGIFVTVSPSSQTTSPSGTLTYTATVQGTSITGVTWALGSGSTAGCTISPSGNTCTMTAASTTHGGGAVVATAVADTSVSGAGTFSW